MPELLGKSATYVRLFDRFGYKSCGPVTGVLLVAGLWAVWVRRERIGPILGWTVAGLAFFFIMAPLMRRHDYYELMLLPAASVWAAVGWVHFTRADGAWRARAGAAVLVAAVVIQSPLVMRGQFEVDEGFLVVAGRIHELCAEGERFVIAGPADGVDVIHYARREGWALHDRPVSSDWRARLERYRSLGARYLVVYDNDEASEQLKPYVELTRELPLVESRSGPWLTHGRTGTYWLMSLRGGGPAAARLTNGTSPSPPG
jgi:hypothetical protein